MKAYGIGPQNGLGCLHLQELADPVAGPGEVVVKVIAAGLNFRDLMVLQKQYGKPQPAERVPLSDGVGVVESLGEGVTGLAVGDRVIAPNFLNWRDGPYNFGIFANDLGVTANGWLAERICLPSASIIHLPDSISDATAATLSVAGGTVWHAMFSFADARSGELVLAQGTGGIAIFALQLAKARGIAFAITSSSDEKLAKCRGMGADYTVNYREHPDWAAKLLEQSGGRGADVVVDTLGFPSLGETISACAPNARIATLGALSGRAPDESTFSQGDLIAKNITIKGIASGSRVMLQSAVDLVESGNIEMTIDRIFAFEDAPAAFAHLESGGHLGKILITL
jgi:NADPH:quinone reductase-like Zn-dependent oxidoreductase